MEEYLIRAAELLEHASNTLARTNLGSYSSPDSMISRAKDSILDAEYVLKGKEITGDDVRPVDDPLVHELQHIVGYARVHALLARQYLENFQYESARRELAEFNRAIGYAKDLLSAREAALFEDYLAERGYDES